MQRQLCPAALAPGSAEHVGVSTEPPGGALVAASSTRPGEARASFTDTVAREETYYARGARK